MLGWALVAVVAVPTEEAVDHLRRAFVETDPAAVDREGALVDLAAALGVPPAALPDRAGSIRAARDRLGRTATWRIREEGALVEVDLVDPSGHLDRIRAWYVTSQGRERVHAASSGLRWRFRTPRGWPEQGRLELEATSSLVPGAPALMRHVVAPLGVVPEAPAGSEVPPRPPTVASAGGRTTAWWVWVAGVAAAGAVGLGVWQETR